METAMKIRRLILVDGHSIRSVSKTTGIARNTIKKYLQDATPPTYQRQIQTRSKILDQHSSLLTQWFSDDLLRPKRERRTAKKLYEQLVEQGYIGSYFPVCRHIKQLREEHPFNGKGFIPMEFEAGDALQFDWSLEVVVIAGVMLKIKVAHFKLSYSRKPFVIAYPRETQEMLLDAFIKAFDFYHGIPKRVLIDNPKTMVTKIGKGKARDFHPRFLALMNHYLIEPVACTPASGWEKGQVERQVQYLRKEIFTPQLSFNTLEELNEHLLARSVMLATKAHPQLKSQSINAVFQQEQSMLAPLGRPFDGYVEKTIRVTSTCLVQIDSNHYSVPSQYAKQPVSVRAYATRIVIYFKLNLIAEHARSFNKHEYQFDPWHYVPLLPRKPGALRDGAPFKQWKLSSAVTEIKHQYLKRLGGDKEFVELLLLMQTHSEEVVTMACELALEEKTPHLATIINIINRLIEPDIPPLKIDEQYPKLRVVPEANCARYDKLRHYLELH